MGKKKGRAWLLRVSDGSGGWLGLAGITAKSLKINNSRIDVTAPDADDPEGVQWRESLDDVKSIDASGDYMASGAAAEARLIELAMSTAAEEEFQIIVPGQGTFEGFFSIDLEFSGDGAVSGSVSLASNGEVAFTPPS